MQQRKTFLFISAIFLFSLSSCSLLDSPERTANQFVKILNDKVSDLDTKSEQIYAIISENDRDFLSRMANAFITRDIAVWEKFFEKELCKNIVSRWFAKGIEQNISNTTDFRNMVLKEVITIEAINFLDAEYHETERTKEKLKKVTYIRKVSGTTAISRSIHTFTNDGETEIFLTPRILKLNRDMRWASNWGNEVRNNNPVKFALNLLN